MIEEPEKTRIRLDLTERQKAQIRQATGREVNTLELRLQGLPEQGEYRTGEEERPHGQGR
jgi:hypothetical protein